MDDASSHEHNAVNDFPCIAGQNAMQNVSVATQISSFATHITIQCAHKKFSQNILDEISPCNVTKLGNDGNLIYLLFII